MNPPSLNSRTRHARLVFPLALLVAVFTAAAARAQTVDAVDDFAETGHYDSIPIDVLANDDADNGIDPTSVEVTLPAIYGSTSVDSQTGVITYTPDGKYSGEDSFFYKFRDLNGVLSNKAMVQVTVDAPVYPDAEDDYPADVPYNTPQVFWPLDNDTGFEAPIDETSLTILTPPAKGTVTVNPDGSVNYVPDDGAENDDWFSYTVADELGNVSNEAYVYVWIDPDEAPTIEMDWKYELNGSVTFFGTVFDDQSTANLTVTFGGLLDGQAPATTDAQGNFNVNVIMPPGTSGYFTAATHDVWGLDSEPASFYYSSP